MFVPGISDPGVRSVDLSDQMIVGVGDVDVARPINSHPGRVAEAGSSTGAVGRPGDASGAGKCGDVSGAGASDSEQAGRCIKGCLDGARDTARSAGAALDRPVASVASGWALWAGWAGDTCGFESGQAVDEVDESGVGGVSNNVCNDMHGCASRLCAVIETDFACVGPSGW